MDYIKNDTLKENEGIEDIEKVQINSDAEINAENIMVIMKGAPIKTKQEAISIPKVKKFYNLYKDGKNVPPIQVCKETNTIVDGNHRYIAGMLCGIEVEIRPAGISPSWKDKPIINWEDVKCDDEDWGK